MTPDSSPKSVCHKRRPIASKAPTLPTTASLQIPAYIPALAFFLFAFAFAWLWVNPALHYQSRMPLFYLGTPFLSEMVSKPGGLLRYACNFVEHFYRTPWLGALLMTAVLGAVWAVANSLLQTVRSKAIPLTAGVLLVLETRYDFPWLETAVGLLLASGAAMAYRKIPGTAARLAFFSAFSVILNFLAGPVPAALFALLAGASEWAAQRHGLTAGVLAAALAIGFGVAQVYLPSTLLLPWTTRSGWISMAVFYLCFLVPFLVCTLRPPGADEPQNEGLMLARRRRRGALKWTVLATSIAAAFALSNTTRKGMLEIEYHAEREEWAQVLQVVPHLKQFDGPTRVHINRALYHQGAMLELLFKYWHRVDQALLPGPETGLEICRASSATLLELGQVNLAEHLAHEALEVEGDKPCILQLLFKINMAKERPQAARTFLGLLRKDPFYRAWADYNLAHIKELSEDPELLRLRALKVTTDNPADSLAANSILLQCLDTNPKNRMAFEYLMAYYLLNMKAENVVKHLVRLDDVEMPELPTLLQEAILAHHQLVLQETGQTPPINLYGRTLQSPALQRFERFKAILVGNKGDVKTSQATLAREMGNSYLYYSVYTETAFKPGAKFQ